ERDALQPRERSLARPRMPALKRAQSLDLSVLLIRARARELQRIRLFVAALLRILKRVDPHDRQLTGVLELLVLEALVLDLAALVLPLHGPEHAAALVDAQELLEHGLLDQLGQLLDDVAAL